MAGGLMYALGGALSGHGEHLVNEANALREQRLEELRHSRLMQREQADREWRSSEAEKSREHERGMLDRRSDVDRSNFKFETQVREQMDERRADREIKNEREQEDYEVLRRRQGEAKGYGTETIDPKDRMAGIQELYELELRRYYDKDGNPLVNPEEIPDNDALYQKAVERFDSTAGTGGRRRERGRGREESARARAVGSGTLEDPITYQPDRTKFKEGLIYQFPRGLGRYTGDDENGQPQFEEIVDGPAREVANPEPTPRAREESRRQPAPSQSDRYAGEMRGEPRPTRRPEPVRGRAEQSWGAEPVQGEPADIGGAVRRGGQRVIDALTPNPGGILTEEGQERQRRQQGEDWSVFDPSTVQPPGSLSGQEQPQQPPEGDDGLMSRNIIEAGKAGGAQPYNPAIVEPLLLQLEDIEREIEKASPRRRGSLERVRDQIRQQLIEAGYPVDEEEE